MKCNNAEALIMRYMDGELTDAEAHRLNEHIGKCDSCREEFNAYDEVASLFFESEIVEAPPEFSERVMARIACITPNYISGSKWTLTNVTGTLWGIYCIIFGFGIMAIMYRDSILNTMAQMPTFLPILSVLNKTRDIIVSFSIDITASVTQFTNVANMYITQSKVIVLVLLAVIVGLQIVLYIKNKDKVEAE